MARYTGTVEDQNGFSLPGALVLVNLSYSTTKAILSDDSGNSLPNPLISGLLGAYVFNADDGVYDITWSFAGRIIRQLFGVVLGDGLAGNIFGSLLSSPGGPGYIGFSHSQAYSPASLGAKLRREVHVEDAPWYANSPLVPNKAAAFQAAIDHVSSLGGGTVRYGHSGDSYLFTSKVTARRNVTIVGPTGRADPGNPFAGRSGFFEALQKVSKLWLSGSATLDHEGAGGWECCYIVRAGTPLDGTANPANFSGTAFALGQTDAITIYNCSILGFDKAQVAGGTARVSWSNVLIDCNNGVKQETSYDENTYEDVHCYGVLQGDVGPTSPLTLRSGSAFYLGGTFNGGPTLFSCFEYGFNVGFNIAAPGSYKFIGCWSDGPHNASTGRPLDPTSVGVICLSADPSIPVAEPQLMGLTVSAKGTGIVLGADLYGATIMIGAHIFQCAVGINCSAQKVLMIGGAIRSYFDAGIIFNNKAAADSARLVGVTFYDPQPSSTAEINCSNGDPVMVACSRADGPMREVNKVPSVVARDGSGLVVVPDARDTIRITGSGAIGDIQPRRPGRKVTFVFAQAGLSIPNSANLKTAGGSTVSGGVETSVTMRVDPSGLSWWEEGRAVF